MKVLKPIFAVLMLLVAALVFGGTPPEAQANTAAPIVKVKAEKASQPVAGPQAAITNRIQMQTIVRHSRVPIRLENLGRWDFETPAIPSGVTVSSDKPPSSWRIYQK